MSLTINRGRLSEVMCVIEDSAGATIQPLVVPAIDIDALIVDLADSSLSVSGLSYTYVDLMTSGLTVTDVRNCFTLYLDATFIQAADIVALQNSFQTVFNGLADVSAFGSVTVTIAGQFELVGPNG